MQYTFTYDCERRLSIFCSVALSCDSATSHPAPGGTYSCPFLRANMTIESCPGATPSLLSVQNCPRLGPNIWYTSIGMVNLSCIKEVYDTIQSHIQERSKLTRGAPDEMPNVRGSGDTDPGRPLGSPGIRRAVEEGSHGDRLSHGHRPTSPPCHGGHRVLEPTAGRNRYTIQIRCGDADDGTRVRFISGTT